MEDEEENNKSNNSAKFETELDIKDEIESNITEIKNLYSRNKKIVWALLIASATFSISGLIIILISFFKELSFDPKLFLYAIIPGLILVLISFYSSNRFIKQQNLFYNKLLETQKYLTAISLAEKTKDKKDLLYAYIISSLLGRDDININDALKK